MDRVSSSSGTGTSLLHLDAVYQRLGFTEQSRCAAVATAPTTSSSRTPVSYTPVLLEAFAQWREEAAQEKDRGRIIHWSRMMKVFREWPTPIRSLDDVRAIPGVGPSTLTRVNDLLPAAAAGGTSQKSNVVVSRPHSTQAQRTAAGASQSVHNKSHVATSKKSAAAMPKRAADAPLRPPVIVIDEDDNDNEDDDNVVVVVSRAKETKAVSSVHGDADKAPFRSVMLAQDYEKASIDDPKHWWMSEKLDGVRAVWDAHRRVFWSRQGNVFDAPEWFKRDMPTAGRGAGNLAPGEYVDGELWSGRGNFQDVVGIVHSGPYDERWRTVRYAAFDVFSQEAPGGSGVSQQPFEARLERLTAMAGGKGGAGTGTSSAFTLVQQTPCRSRQHVADELERVVAAGGEGVMLRRPGSTYTPSRSSSLLKVKKTYDADARVVDYEPGKGRNEGVVGALWCEMRSGKRFKIGTGLSDAVRAHPPRIGTIVSYAHKGLTRDGKPRHASFVRERHDVHEPSDPQV